MVRRTNSMCCYLSFLIVVLVVYFNISETECKGQKVRKVKEKSDSPTTDKKPNKPKPEFNGKPSETLSKSTFEKKNGKYGDETSSESSMQIPDINNDPNIEQNAEKKLEKPKGKIAKPKPNSDYDKNSDESSHSTKSHESRSKATKSKKVHSNSSSKIPDYPSETASTGSSSIYKTTRHKSDDHSDSSRSGKTETSQTGSAKNTNLDTGNVTPVNGKTGDFNFENTEAAEPITPGTVASVSKDTTKAFTESTTSETSTTSTVIASETAAYTTPLLSEVESEIDTEHGHGHSNELKKPEFLHVIKPPYPSRRKCNERTPRCCIGGQLEINLGTIGVKGRVLGELDGVKTEISDQPQKRFTRCSFSAKIKVSFEPMGSDGCFGCTKAPFCGRRLLQLELDLSRNKRRNTLFYISDSSFENEGASVLAEYPNVTIHPRHSAENRTNQIRIQGAVNAYTNKLTIFIGNQFIRLINDKRLDENFCDNDLFHLNGQFDPENGGMSPNEITIGINEAVSSGPVSSEEDPASFGVCSAKVKWTCPWQES